MNECHCGIATSKQSVITSIKMCEQFEMQFHLAHVQKLLHN